MSNVEHYSGMPGGRQNLYAHHLSQRSGLTSAFLYGILILILSII